MIAFYATPKFPSLARLHFVQIWPLSFVPCLTPLSVPLCTDPSTRPHILELGVQVTYRLSYQRLMYIYNILTAFKSAVRNTNSLHTRAKPFTSLWTPSLMGPVGIPREYVHGLFRPFSAASPSVVVPAPFRIPYCSRFQNTFSIVLTFRRLMSTIADVPHR